jgi:ABC-type amino acid transport substrate-binding protein/heat shock protein HslJ
MSENLPDEVPEYDEFEGEDLADAAPAATAADDDFDDDFESDAEEDSGSNRSILILIIAVIALILCGALAIILLVVRPFTPDEPPTMAATAEPVESPAVATPDEPGGLVDPVWERVQESGKLLVGTSADYPPFEFYTDDFQLDGFDIALMEEIGRKLALDVEFKDMAFDGLGNALQVNQIDVAASAISYTPERDGFVDFSLTYFLSEDAVLGTADSTVTLVSATDLAKYKIGVQSGTTYENFARTSLIETGLMPETNLHVYPQMGRALDELSEGHIDVVLLDRAPANEASATGTFKIIATGFSRQQIALAVPQDSFALRHELNGAITELQNEGRIGQLVEQYFGIDPETLPPIPTPDPDQPTPTPAPPQDCIDSMQWVADLSYDDQGLTNIPEVPPGNAFQKGWRVRNTGTCTWTNGYALVPTRGNTPAARMGGVPVPVQGTVAPGQTYDFWANLTAPINPGTYVEYWTMMNPSNVLFGDAIWVAITVPSPATPTPAATQTPSPSANLTVDPQTIQQGQCATLAWTSENVQAVYVYPQGDDWRNYGVPGTGSQTVCPNETTTYEMRVVKVDGSVEVRSITLTVIPNAQAPQITRFTVEPPYSVTLGQCVLVTWIVEGNVSTVNIFRNDTAIWTNAPFSGNRQDCPPATGQYTYKLEASGPGGNSVASQTIQVIDQATPVPTSTVPPEQPTSTPVPTQPPATATPIPDPVIYTFSATPNQVETGQCVTVGWSVGGATDKVQLTKNGSVVYDDAPLRDSVQDCETSSAGTITYGILATNSAGGSASQDTTVTVHESKPDNPLADTNWQLVSYLSGGQSTPVLEGSAVAISFQANGNYAGNGGCNDYSGTYSVNGSQITIGPASSTGKLCDEAVTQQENAYFSLLPTAATYAIANGQLTIQDGSGQTILQYVQLVAVPF